MERETDPPADVEEPVLVQWVLDDVGDEGDESDHREYRDGHVHDVLPENDLKVLVRQLKVGLLLLIRERINASAEHPSEEAHKERDKHLEDVVERDIDEDKKENLVADARRCASVPRRVSVEAKSKKSHDVQYSEANLLYDPVETKSAVVSVLLRNSQLLDNQLKNCVAQRGDE
jgi:hypothetical protein